MIIMRFKLNGVILRNVSNNKKFQKAPWSRLRLGLNANDDAFTKPRTAKLGDELYSVMLSP